MRKLLRSIAHAQMKAEGIVSPNKPKRDRRGRKQPSVFAERWRQYAAERLSQYAKN